MITRLVATLYFTQLYTCSECAISKDGETQREEFSGYSPAALNALLDEVYPKAHYMPVGWASSYHKSGTKFKCDQCLARGW